MDDMTAFRVTYDGPALKHQPMDARELAPALLAIAELLEASCKALYGNKARLLINVKGSFQIASFHIDFVTAIDWLKSVRDIFSGKDPAAVAKGLPLLDALGFFGKRGLAQALVWLKGRRISQVQVHGDTATIHAGDDCIDVEPDTVELIKNLPVRQAFDRVLGPLDKPGITAFAVGDEARASLTIKASSRSFFAVPAIEDVLLVEDTHTMAFSIVSLAFKQDNKWRLSNGSVTVSAIISDSRFLADVERNLTTFAKGDVLVCTVRIKQWQARSGTKTEYEVIAVQKHLRAATQIALPGL